MAPRGAGAQHRHAVCPLASHLLSPRSQRLTSWLGSPLQHSLTGWRADACVSEHVEDGVRHQSALDVRADRCAVIARLKGVPAELRVIPTLDPDPPSVRGQFVTIGLHFSRARQTVPSADDFRDRDSEPTQIHIARMRTADHNESCESCTTLTRQC